MLVFLTAYSSCARNLRLRDSGLFYSSLSGEYAFRFSTGIGTEPAFKADRYSLLSQSVALGILYETRRLFVDRSFLVEL
jgi:hypothetical protein